MSDDQNRGKLIPSSQRSLSRSTPQSNSVINRMTEETMALIRSQSSLTSKKRFKVGRYELAEPDYQQILLWSEQLSMEPAEIVDILENTRPKELETFAESPRTIGFRVLDGSITNLVIDLDFDVLPLRSFSWIDGLRLGMLVIEGATDNPMDEFELPNAPNLTVLSCSQIGTKTDTSR